MKKIAIYLCILAMVVSSMAGCSKKDDSKDEPEKKETKTKTEAAGYEWAKDTVFYQIFVRSFYDSDGDGIGDFNGISKKVDYLKELGVGAVWLMPMMASTTYHGYDVVDYYKTNEDYGSMEDFKNMLKVLHDNNIKVIIDFVVNHTSSENDWFKQAMSDEKSKYRDFYFIEKDGQEVKKLPTAAKYRYSSEYKLFYYGLYDTIMPDLNYDNKDVRTAVKDAAGFWLDAGVDGFRLDGANNIYADEPEKNAEWWKEFTKYVKEKNDKAFVVGENWYNDAESMEYCYGALYSSFDFPTSQNIENASKGKLLDYVTIFNKAIKMYKDAAAAKDSASSLPVVSTMIDNHDMDRIATRVDAASAKLAATLQFTLPGTPFIYYGDELGQTGQSPDVNRREAFDWYKAAKGEGMVDLKKATGSDSKYTVADDKISYEEEKSDDKSMLGRYKKLISIRNENKVLYDGTYATAGATKDGLYAYTVTGAEDKSTILVVHNLGKKEGTFTLKADGKNLLEDKDVKSGDSIKLASKDSIIIKYSGDAKAIDDKEFNYTVEEMNAPKEEISVKIVLTVPKNTPKDDKVYIVGDFNEWNECDENYAMKKTSDTTYEITVKGEQLSDIQYKFTRGTWDKREQNAKGEDLVGEEQKQNRFYTFEEKDKVLNISVEKWMDVK